MIQTQLLPTLKVDYSGSTEDFVSYWKDKYDYLNMELYYNSLRQEPLQREQLADLFRWKNGMNLSGPKWKAWQKIAFKLDIINELRRQFNPQTLEDAFSKVSLVWKIYLLHICRPAEHPIFDQHVYRAYRYIHRQEKVFTKRRELELFYHGSYVPFFDELLHQCPRSTYKDVDDALWAFGRFLAQYPKLLLS